MGWEDDYDEEEDFFNEREFQENQLEKSFQEISNSIIHVDEKLIYRQVGEILEAFHEKFGYSLNPEIESKTVMMASFNGYIAAHFVPTKFNSKEKYYTLLFNPSFKKHPKGYQYSVEFTNGFYSEEEQASDAVSVEVLATANNIQCIIEGMLNHWVVEEMEK